ncbi:MAG: DNA polymerase III subunit beta [Myxococcota bacterium]
MKVTIEVADLLKSLTLLHTVAQRKSSMPILSHVLLQAQRDEQTGAGQLDLSATDLETAMRLCLPCEVEMAGGAAVPARTLFELVRSLPGAKVSLTRDDDGQLHVHSGRVRAQLLTLPQEDFPNVAQPQDVQLLQLNVKQFVDMAQKTLYCTSNDENRFALTGVCCEPIEQESGLMMVATDGHRLSRVRQAGESVDLQLQHAIIVPRKGLTELLRLLQQQEVQPDSRFQLGIMRGQLVAVYNNALLTMRLLQGEFPDYRQVIPKLSDKIVRVSRADLLACLRRAAVLVSEKHTTLRWDLTPGELAVYCHNPDTGEVSDQIAIDYEGPELQIGLNARYALEAISSLDDDNVLIRLTDSASPILLSGIEPEHHQCVVMPIDV